MPELVSVIIPAYRAEATIGAAVRSALEQTYANVEVIVVDDGSDDDTGSKARASAHGDTRFKLLTQANGGVSAARNAAIDAANGSWIAVLNADDAFDPVRVQRLLLRATERGSDLIADNIQLLSRGDTGRFAFPAARMNAPSPVGALDFIASDRPRHGLRSSGFIKPLIRRAFLERHGLRYRAGASVGEDFDFVVRSLLHGARLDYVPEGYYRYTVQDRSLSRGNEGRFFEEFLAISRLLREEATRSKRPDVARALAKREADTERWFTSLAFEAALERGDVALAARSFTKLPYKIYGAYLIAVRARRTVYRLLGR